MTRRLWEYPLYAVGYTLAAAANLDMWLADHKRHRADRRLERAEQRSARWAKNISRNLDNMHIGELPDGEADW